MRPGLQAGNGVASGHGDTYIGTQHVQRHLRFFVPRGRAKIISTKTTVKASERIIQMIAILNMEKFPMDRVGLPPERQSSRVKREDQERRQTSNVNDSRKAHIIILAH